MAGGTVSAQQLRLFVERIERLEEEKAGIATDIKDVYSEAKGQGYDTKIIKEVIKLRAMDRDALAEYEALLDTYKSALGLGGTPLGDYAASEAATALNDLAAKDGAKVSIQLGRARKGSFTAEVQDSIVEAFGGADNVTVIRAGTAA